MAKVKVPPLKPGQIAQESGIYKSTITRQRSTFDKGEKASPTPQPGEKWNLEIPTKPEHR